MPSSKDMPPMTGGAAKWFIKNQFFTTLPRTPRETDLTGQVAIVTGASSGLGLESARQMLTLGLSHVVLAVRSLERGKAAAAKIQPANPAARIDVWLLEMESYSSVQSFVNRCEGELPRIDAIILNAGVTEADFILVASTGHEKAIQVNYHSTMLLAILFLPILRAKSSRIAPPRLTIISSIMSSVAKLPNRSQQPFLASFDETKTFPWDPQERYNSSKLLGQFFLSRLADQVSPDDVIINLVEPGLVKGTGLFQGAKGLVYAIFDVVKAVSARSVEEGALTYIDAAVIKGKESHGCFIVNCEIAPFAPISYQPEAKAISDWIWEETLDEFSFAGARDILLSFEKRA